MKRKKLKKEQQKNINYQQKIIDLLKKKYSYFAIGASVLVILIYFASKTNHSFLLKSSIKKQAPKKIEKITPAKKEAVYQVQEGDTLWSIAEKFYGSGFNMEEIMRANNITNPDNIEKGQILIIPRVTPKQPTKGEIDNHQTKKVEEDKNYYIVQSGDDLWQIALKTYGDGYAWPRIAEANNLVDPNLIEPGTRLIIPR